MLYCTAIITDTNAINHYRKWGMDTDQVYQATVPFGFESQAQLASFLVGVEDGIKFTVCEVDEVAEDALVSRVAFAHADKAFKGFTQKNHSSVAERLAYEEGVKAAEPWSDLLVLEEPDRAEYLNNIGWP